ncbi:E3 ubiquitin ligase family protein [Nocardioides alcanivorans]|uniref:E3 ubiquitin ligase family protein n=1 Tax=Nocardioides alcanivorans TaxID=2897352 RepID=UPI001F412A41|nr:E3 ubiquitin ligase family protein [Nocardioides alcanivorans]
MVWFIVAVLLLAVGVGLTVGARTARNKHKSLLLTENTTTGPLRELHRTAREVAGDDIFTQLVDLSGRTQPGPQGLLTAEISQTQCVWYQQKVTRRYKHVSRDSDGNRKTTTREEVVSQNQSSAPFVLRDKDGEITVIPTDGVKQARKTMSEFFKEEGARRSGATIDFGGFSFNVGSRDGDTIGYKYEEWVLTPDTQVFVHGEASDRGGQLEIVSPAGKEKMLITTKTEQELLESAETSHMWFRWGSFGSYAAGAVLLIVAVVLLVL